MYLKCIYIKSRLTEERRDNMRKEKKIFPLSDVSQPQRPTQLELGQARRSKELNSIEDSLIGGKNPSYTSTCILPESISTGTSLAEVIIILIL